MSHLHLHLSRHHLAMQPVKKSIWVSTLHSGTAKRQVNAKRLANLVLNPRNKMGMYRTLPLSNLP